MDAAKKPRFQWRPAHTGLAVSAATAAVLLAGRSADDASVPVWYFPLFALAAGLLAAAFHSRRLRFLLGGLIFGLVVGALSSLAFFGQPVEGLAFMVSATVTFYAVLCLAAGAFFEFVLFLHHLTHGRKPASYGKPAPGGPAARNGA
ncbi:MAG TPA: hypothetical protein VL426_06875, partial [Candidatus Binatia bacterium]|jgi:hypothetical protein|nr:hypothetical protein [Candidatus Binatia bacterium]